MILIFEIIKKIVLKLKKIFCLTFSFQSIFEIDICSYKVISLFWKQTYKYVNKCKRIGLNNIPINIVFKIEYILIETLALYIIVHVF